MPTNLDLLELTEFRRDLHRTPELSGEEVETARSLARSVGTQCGLSIAFEVCDNFAAPINDRDAYGVATAAMEALGVAFGDEGDADACF